MSCTPNNGPWRKSPGITLGVYPKHLYRGESQCVRCGHRMEREMSEYPWPDKEIVRYLTKEEIWLYRFGHTSALAGVSGPKITIRQLLGTLSGLRHRMELARGKIMMIDASPAGSFNAKLKNEAVDLILGPDYD